MGYHLRLYLHCLHCCVQTRGCWAARSLACIRMMHMKKSKTNSHTKAPSSVCTEAALVGITAMQQLLPKSTRPGKHGVTQGRDMAKVPHSIKQPQKQLGANGKQSARATETEASTKEERAFARQEDARKQPYEAGQSD